MPTDVDPLASQSNAAKPLTSYFTSMVMVTITSYMKDLTNLKCKPATPLDLFLDQCLIILGTELLVPLYNKGKLTF